MKIKTIISLTIIIAMMLLALGGCGSNKSNENVDNAINDSTNSSQNSEKDEGEEDKAGEDVFRGKIDSVSVSDDIIVARTADGKACVIGGNTLTSNMNTGNWNDIIAVSAGSSHILGLRTDGTVIASGNGSRGQTNVGGWKDIVAIHAGLNQSFGLKSDGTVVMTVPGGGEVIIEGWKDIVSIEGMGDYLWGLTASGDVYVRSKTSPVYSGVKSIHCNASYALFVLEGGSVVADPVSKGYERYYSGIEGWTDIVDVQTLAYNHAIGLKSDGTVVAVGQNEDGRGDVSSWSDIVAIATGNYHTVGLRADGTVVATGDNGYGQCDVSDWNDIVSVYAGKTLTVGLRADGTIVAAGEVWNGLDGIEFIKNVATE